MLDVVPPAPVALTLTSGGKPVKPGSTLRTAPAELTLGWTASSDGSGVGDYLARWSATSAETTTVSTRAHSPAGPLEDVYTAGEAERLHGGPGQRRTSTATSAGRSGARCTWTARRRRTTSPWAT